MTVAAFIADLSVTMVRSLTRLKVSAGPVSPVEGALGRGGGGGGQGQTASTLGEGESAARIQRHEKVFSVRSRQ